jgi:ribosomal protein L21
MCRHKKLKSLKKIEIAHNYHKILAILCEISNRFKGKKLCDLKKKKKKKNSEREENEKN